MTTKPEKAFVEKSWNPPTDISVFVDLASPPNSGQIRFHFPDNVLVSICKKMLNEDVSPGSPEVLDCAGELSNMFYGFAKSKLNEDGYSFKLSLPQPTKTEKLPDPNSSYSYIIIPFKVLDETCFIQIIIL